MDISRPVTDYLPQTKGGSGERLWKAVLLLLGALLGATLLGTLGYFLLHQIAPAVPAYAGIVIGLVCLIVILRYIIVRYAWMLPWFYLLPAIIFLSTFALFPMVLTILLAFSDYAGSRNGELNISTSTPVESVEGAVVQVSDSASLRCADLRNGCINVPVRVLASGSATVSATKLEGATLTLAEALPAGAQPAVVTLELKEFGISAEFNVVGAEGNTLTLERAPPGEVDLEKVGLELPGETALRTITAVKDNALTLDSPLEAGKAYSTITRYNDFGFIGFKNFRTILRQASQSLWPVLSWNLIFAVATVVINTVFGVFLAIFLNNKNLRFRNLYRTLLIIPWALPSVITIQVWKGFFNANFGAINRTLALLDLPVYDWLGAIWPARAALLIVNLWLGLPFLMTATLGALSAIPDDLYEAAKIDGANLVTRVRSITLPLLRNALLPITLTAFAFNFNNFALIYLLTEGAPAYEGGVATARSTDILISWAYNVGFKAQGGSQYGLTSAISVLIFFVTIAISLVNFKVTGALKEEGER